MHPRRGNFTLKEKQNIHKAIRQNAYKAECQEGMTPTNYQNKLPKQKHQNKIPKKGQKRPKKGGNTHGTEGCRDQKDVFAEAPAFPGVDPQPVP